METIIGLLFILLPVIFKLVGKKLEQAGNLEKAGKFKNIAEAMGGDGETPILDWLSEEPEEEKTPSEPMIVVEQAPAPVHLYELEEARSMIKKPSATRKPVVPVLNEEPRKKVEKIDPKKLVIYSEIMKPKYEN